MNFNPNTYTLNALISAPKIPTDFLWALSLFFVVIALVYFGSVFFFRNRLSRLGKHIKAKRKIFSPMISEFLFFEEEGEKKEKINYIDLKIQIRELIKNRFDREVLTSVLMDLRKDVTGKTRTELFRIYQDLELHKDAYGKLNSWRWELISKGIYELTQMEVKDSYSLITRFINDKRATIRKQAEIATVSLKEEGINYFLDHTKYRISEWQQLKLLDVVRNKTDYKPPAFRLWLTSKNNDVVLFSLRLIKYYNQNDASASLIQLLRHKSDAIKKEAIFCIRDFNVTDAVPVLKTIFWKCTTDVKMYLLEALSQLGTEEDIGFLEDIITKEVAFTVKGKAISALNTIRPEGILPTQDIFPKEDFELTEPTPLAKIVSTKKGLKPSIKTEKQTDIEDIPVVNEIVLSNMKDTSPPTLEILPTEIAFLPIVTDGTPKTVINPSKDEKRHKDFWDMEVYFEEVRPTATVKELHYDFLPIVTAEAIVEEKQTLTDFPVRYEEVNTSDKLKHEQKKITKKVTNDILVTYEELKFPKIASKENKEIKKDTKSILTKNTQEPKLEFSDSIATENVSHIKVIYDILNVDETVTPKVDCPEIDWCSAFDFQNVKHPEKASVKTKLENDMEIELTTIPKPLFYDNATLDTVALLEDIAELGDHREIPHLKMLLKQETNAAIKRRIKELLSCFSNTDEIQISFEPTLLQERQSVFHSLFEVSDTEAKIILLDEIAEVGDEQEIALLETLLLSNEVELKNAAERALDKLSSRLNNTYSTASMEEQTPRQKKSTELTSDEEDLFKVDFDFETPVKNTKVKKDHHRNQKDGNTLFDHLCAMSTSLYRKD